MKKTWIRTALAMLLMLSLMLTSCVSGGLGNNGDDYEDYTPNKQPGKDQFDFPGNYAAPELKIDGVDDDAQWANAKTIATFGHGGAATIKIYRGEQALFFFANVADTILATEGETNDDAVTRSDSVEIYIDTLADGGLKPQNDDYQINLGIHGKTRIMQGSGSGWGGWNGLIDYEVQLNGVLNDGYEAVDTGYTVEIMIPYSQIGIEKDDTIAVSFAQVDKVASGASATIDWDWYGWEYNGKIVEPQTPNNYLLLDKDGNVMSRDEESKPDADMAGYVIDYVTGNPIAGATVTIASPEGLGIESVVTDEQGYYAFEKVNPEMTYILSVEKENYFSNTVEYSRTELRDANGGRVLKNVTLRNENDVEKTTVVGTVKNIVYGTVEGALVVVEGTTLSAITDANGIFTIEGVPAEESITLVVSHDLYDTSKTTVPAEMLVANGESNVGDVNINLPYAFTGGFGNKSDKFASSEMYVSRTLTGIEMILEGTRKLDGKIEVYLDVKESADHRDQDATMWRFDLDSNGVIAVVDNYAAEGNGSAYGLDYVLYYNDSTGYSARFFIPYTYLGIAPLDVFGISLGQWSTTATDWDGWGFNGQFIAPELPKQFVRVSATNELYRQDNNTSMVNLSGNAGMSGVKVEVNGISTVTGANGAWSMKAVRTSEAVNIVYSRQGYVSYTTTIPAGYFDTNYDYSENVTLEKQTVTLSGIITNDRTGAPVAGATVSISGTDVSVLTDENGKYTIAGLGTEVDVLLKVEAEGYATKEESISAVTLASQSSHTLNIALVESNNINYITLSGKITNVNGPVAGVSVSVVGNSELSVLTNANGEFAIENYPAIDCVIHIEKAGYISQDITMKADDIAKTAKEHSIGEIDFLLEYAKLHGVIADKSDAFAAFVGYVTRSKTGFEFKFVGSRPFTGQLEFFVDTKTSAGDNARDTSDYLFMLKADGGLQIVNWGEGVKNETIPANMLYTLKNADTAPELTFTLPYDFFGQVDPSMALAPTEVIGISAGQWMGTDWDGWDNFNLIGINNAEFVKPEWPQDYVRIAADNTLYSKADNVTVDFSSYQIHFGTGMMTPQSGSTGAGALGNAGLNADDMYAKVAKRDENGVTFEIITTGNFAMNTNTNEKEMILIYFDTGLVSNDGWNPDYLIKIASDGTVYGNAAAWWSANDSYKLGTTATITTENCVTKIVYTVAYDTIGIGATEIFGIAMREASHNAGDHMLYDPWHDCYFENETIGIDAAACTQFIRVAADGTLYRANNNQ